MDIRREHRASSSIARGVVKKAEGRDRRSMAILIEELNQELLSMGFNQEADQ